MVQTAEVQLEVSVVGREGMTGTAVLLHADTSPNELFMQMAGSGWRIEAETFRAMVQQSPALLTACLRYVHVLWVQTAQTAVANGRNTIEERLARWLLMMQDRSQGTQFPLTHEFLSLMLGVHRPGVTLALHMLEGARLVKLSRRSITIVNRADLMEVAGRAYGIAEAEQARLFPASHNGGKA